jgi:copper(I)-binding protein
MTRARGETIAIVMLCLTLALAGCARRASRLTSGRLEIPLVIAVAPVVETPAVLYATVVNGTDRPDTLTGLTAAIADSTTLHQMIQRGAGMAMSRLGALPLPAHSEVRFHPGGYHAMLEGLRARLTPGDSIPVTFHFALRGDTTVFARVLRYADLDRALEGSPR